MSITGGARLRYLVLGALLRIALLAYGFYQDAHSAVPYTDIDYSVFLDGARNLVHGCPIQAAVPSRSDPMDTLQEYLDPPLAPLNGCSKGWLSVGARYILQHEDILSARSRGQEKEAIRRNTPDDEEPFLTTSDEPGFIDTKLLPMSLALLKPFLKPLASMGNPYARPTYRYTPLLAALLAPGAAIGGSFERIWGKLLFVVADILAAVLMWDICAVRDDATNKQAKKAQDAAPHPTQRSLLSRLYSGLHDVTHSVGLLWLLNPFPAQIATRGSCEPIISVLVLAFTSAGARIVYADRGLAPVPVTGAADHAEIVDGAKTAEDADISKQAPPPLPEVVPGALPALPLPVLLAPVFLALAVHMKLFPVVYGIPMLSALLFAPSGPRWVDAVAFAGSSAYALLGLTALVWMVWGQPYLQESILYHVTRLDHRHNFSPYFLPLYLLHTPAADGFLPDLPGSELVAKLSSFAPQLAVVAWIGYRVARHDVVVAFAAQTMAFVVWNKVSTSQYFIWYLTFLPIVLPSLRFSSPTAGWSVLVVWIASQAVWLHQAYLLEFTAKDTFVHIWAASLLYVVGHAWVLERLLDAWHRGRSSTIEIPSARGSVKAASVANGKSSIVAAPAKDSFNASSAPAPSSQSEGGGT